jgi:glycosyltransferase involved in cell wall biosynthesis
MKKKILLFADWYAPGYKAGGPIRSCVNFTEHLKPYYEIYVFTSDRDLGSDTPYEGIGTDSWVEAGGGVYLFYSSPANRGLQQIKRQIAHVAPDFIYLNSMFSVHFTLFPLWIARGMGASRPRLVLSPRGMLRNSALRFKPAKKKFFLRIFRLLGFQSFIHFLAADEEEQKDIRLQLGSATVVSLIPNLPAVLVNEPGSIEKRSGSLSMIFVGRVHPIKNLDYLLQVMTTLPFAIRLTIVGNMEDKAYWEKCRQIIGVLPKMIEVEYLGEIPNEQIAGLIKKHHIFALPTQGENFGHAIFESLSSKRPVLISDQTPWRRLSDVKTGWDLSLEKPEDFSAAIQQAIAWDQDTFDEWSESAFRFACHHREKSDALVKYKQLFS